MKKRSNITVRVTPDARREKVEETAPHCFAISVKEPALGNQANDRVREIIALRYGVAAKKVRFVSGARALTKRLEVLE